MMSFKEIGDVEISVILAKIVLTTYYWTKITIWTKLLKLSYDVHIAPMHS